MYIYLSHIISQNFLIYLDCIALIAAQSTLSPPPPALQYGWKNATTIPFCFLFVRFFEYILLQYINNIDNINKANKSLQTIIINAMFTIDIIDILKQKNILNIFYWMCSLKFNVTSSTRNTCLLIQKIYYIINYLYQKCAYNKE